MAELPFADLLGRVLTLPVRRMGPPGAFLAVDPADPSPNAKALLLPGSEMPENTKEGDEIEVFVYLDSEDRPIMTVHPPKVALGQVAEVRETTGPDLGQSRRLHAGPVTYFLRDDTDRRSRGRRFFIGPSLKGEHHGR